MGVDEIYNAVIGRDINTIEDELNAGTDINGCDSINRKPALIHAIENDDIDMCEYLIIQGSDVNKCGLGYAISQLTPLMIAVKNNNLEIVKLLAKYGANKNMYNTPDNLKTAFQYAKDYNRINIVNWMMKNEYDVVYKPT